MRIPNQYNATIKLESYLGDPVDSDNSMSYKRTVALDEKDQYPEAACQQLNDFGLNHYYYPDSYGGKLISYLELFNLWKTVARRDLSVIIAHGKSWVGGLPIFIGGSEEQKKRAAEILKTGDQIALGLTEKDHGSDLLSTELCAEPVSGGFLLSGEKWLINNIVRGKAICLFAKTETSDDSLFSLFFVDKEYHFTQPGTYEDLPKIMTLGIRGIHVAALRFNACPIPENAVIGTLGDGLEHTIKSLQMTRCLMPAYSMGAGDTALRIALGFSLTRHLHNQPIFSIPHTRTSLLNAFIDLLIGDCVSTISVRAINMNPEQLIIWHCISKYIVPELVDQLIRDTAAILGARYYLREEYEYGVFQKILRDHLVISVFDGSTPVVLSWMLPQLVNLSRTVTNTSRDWDSIESKLQQLCSLHVDETFLDVSRLTLSAKENDLMMDGLFLAQQKIGNLANKHPDNDIYRILSKQLKLAVIKAEDNFKQLAATPSTQIKDFSKSEKGFNLAKKHCIIHAISTCVNLWFYNRDLFPQFFANGAWLVLAIRRLLMKLGEAEFPIPATITDDTCNELLRLFRNDQLFSFFPIDLSSRHSQCEPK